MTSMLKKFHTHGHVFCLAIFLLAAPAGLLSASALDNRLMIALPDYYPANIDHYGMLEKIVKRNEVIIDGTSYYLDRRVKIFTPNTKYGAHRHLKEKTRIGFIIKDRSAQIKIIKAIYIMPDFNPDSIT